MSDARYNAEKYLDLTAHDGIQAAIRSSLKMGYRPLVYVCSPYAGDTEANTARARDFCRFAIRERCIPVAPHLLYPQFMDDDDEIERETGLFMGCILLTKCAEVWVFGERVTDGMAREIRKAKRLGLPIRRFTNDCMEVSKC